ncbi:MAG TPA: radical SAM protein [Candidatus Nanoarchaeia archaeon]|nr:radical SAM protein [Candidatus Nanoarchaeia archaeon]
MDKSQLIIQEARLVKKVALVNPYPYYATGVNEATIYPPLGLASIAAVLEKNGFICKIIDANVLKKQPSIVFDELKEFSPDILGVYLNVVTARSGIEISKRVKERLGIPVVLGGPFFPEKIDLLLDRSMADIFVQGEAELTFLEICQGKAWKEIDGIMFKDNGQLIVNKPRELIPNLDDLPFSAFHLLPPLGTYTSRSRRKPMAAIFTSRGCPYKCIFCSSSSLKSPFKNRFRSRSPKHVVDEIEWLIKDFGVKEIDVLDDNFTLDIPRAEKILDMIIERGLDVAINLQNGVRADRLTFELVKKMKRAGVYKAGIGIESGNEEILRSIKKSLTLSAVRQAVKWFREVGIVSIGFFMIGFPNDTEETINQTIDFAIDLNPSIANFMIALPLPNTELYDIIQANGWLTKATDEEGTESGFYAADFHYQTPYIDKGKVIELQKAAYRRFYFRPSKMFEVLNDIRSIHELIWTVRSARPLLMNVIRKANQKKKAEEKDSGTPVPV